MQFHVLGYSEQNRSKSTKIIDHVKEWEVAARVQGDLKKVVAV